MLITLFDSVSESSFFDTYTNVLNTDKAGQNQNRSLQFIHKTCTRLKKSMFGSVLKSYQTHFSFWVQ